MMPARNAEPTPWRGRERGLAWAFVLPALGILALVSIAPMIWTAWESIHLDDLRMPWLGRPLVGLANYREALQDQRFLGAVAHTLVFAAVAVTLEVAGGLVLALALDRVTSGTRVLRTAVLLPWAVPTVVAALVWRFMFESPGGLVSRIVEAAGVPAPTWFADPLLAWLPIVLADVWKTTPFVTLLLVAGLQNIDRSIVEAATIDGAGDWAVVRYVIVPLLRPAIVLATLFRLLDAFRVFDIVYVLTGGGPGTATEPVALYTFSTLLRSLRFGYGSALAMLVFAVALALALVAVRAFSTDAGDGR